MAYQIPKKVKVRIIQTGAQKIPLGIITPSEYVKLKNGTLTLYFQGCVGQVFTMKLNLYKESAGRALMISSNTVTNAQVVRTANWYGEVRFDFPTIGNNMLEGNGHYLELEISAGYTATSAQFVCVPYDNDDTLGAIYHEFYDPTFVLFYGDRIPHRLSLFFEKE